MNKPGLVGLFQPHFALEIDHYFSLILHWTRLEAQGLLKRMGEKNPHIRINYPEIQQEILRILRTR